MCGASTPGRPAKPQFMSGWLLHVRQSPSPDGVGGQERGTDSAQECASRQMTFRLAFLLGNTLGFADGCLWFASRETLNNSESFYFLAKATRLFRVPSAPHRRTSVRPSVTVNTADQPVEWKVLGPTGTQAECRLGAQAARPASLAGRAGASGALEVPPSVWHRGG